MIDSTPIKSDLFTRGVAAVAIGGPIFLVLFSGTLPQGLRGQLIVDGHMFIVTALASALILRAVYALGFSQARKRLALSQNLPLTA
jgi:hypothetical protein